MADIQNADDGDLEVPSKWLDDPKLIDWHNW